MLLIPRNAESKRDIMSNFGKETQLNEEGMSKGEDSGFKKPDMILLNPDWFLEMRMTPIVSYLKNDVFVQECKHFVDEDENNLLHYLFMNCEKFDRMTNLLLKWSMKIGIDFNKKNKTGMTPFYYYMNFLHQNDYKDVTGFRNFFEEILESVDISTKHANGNTFLHLLCFSPMVVKHSDLLKRVIKRYPSLLLEKNNSRQTPLHVAMSFWRRRECLHLLFFLYLMTPQVGVCCYDSKGRNIFHLACEYGLKSIVQDLIVKYDSRGGTKVGPEANASAREVDIHYSAVNNRQASGATLSTKLQPTNNLVMAAGQQYKRKETDINIVKRAKIETDNSYVQRFETIRKDTLDISVSNEKKLPCILKSKILVEGGLPIGFVIVRNLNMHMIHFFLKHYPEIFLEETDTKKNILNCLFECYVIEKNPSYKKVFIYLIENPVLKQKFENQKKIFSMIKMFDRVGNYFCHICCEKKDVRLWEIPFCCPDHREMFHYGCMKKWLSISKSCPMCDYKTESKHCNQEEILDI